MNTITRLIELRARLNKLCAPMKGRKVFLDKDQIDESARQILDRQTEEPKMLIGFIIVDKFEDGVHLLG